MIAKQFLKGENIVSKMRNINTTLLRNIGFFCLSALLIFSGAIAVLTHTFASVSSSHTIFLFLIEHHTLIMLLNIIIAVTFGFALAYLSRSDMHEQKNKNKKILNIVLQFLNHEDKKIINFLLEAQGETTQTDISKLPGMNRLRAHRALKRMEEKSLITVEPFGKVRKIKLKDELRQSLAK